MKNIVSYFPKGFLKESTELFVKKGKVTFSGGGNSSSKAMILSDALRGAKGDVRNVFWIVSDKSEVESVKKACDIWSDYPVYSYVRRADEEMVNFSSSSDFYRVREVEVLEFVARLSEGRGIFVIDFYSLVGDFPDFEDLFRGKEVISSGKAFDVMRFIGRLVDMGYEVAEEEVVSKGEYFRKGDSLFVYPINKDQPVRIDFEFDKVEKITVIDEEDYKKELGDLEALYVFPLEYENEVEGIVSMVNKDDLVLDDEVDVMDEHYNFWNEFMEEVSSSCKSMVYSSFNDDVANHLHLHFLSVLKYRTAYDFANDMRDKIAAGYKTIFFTKNVNDIRALFSDQSVPFKVGLNDKNFKESSVCLVEVEKDDSFPMSFQAPKAKINLLTDQDVSFLKESKKSQNNQNIFNDFLTSLKNGDYVVHADHGVAKFLGLDQKTVDEITKEYLKLGYAENDKLFVPIDQAGKVNKYIGSEELMPKLTRLGSAEWNTLTSKVKKETQKIAKELLKLYAQRGAAKGHSFSKDTDVMEKFEATFPYKETPGQLKAINDVKADMEKPEPMDRLVCGDVGFGKTEVAMRAAFKAVQSGKQVAVVSPITILADQHYKSFKKRMEAFNVRVDMLSRFRTASQQKKIIEKAEKGEMDIIVGTHRLLQPDVKFKKLGLVIIDEEQRFGVKQKEKLKEMRKEVDILTLTATPIPRTLNICLNNLRDITTITTPPYGRLPVITEVRKYSPSLVKQAVMKEVERGGQVYFLHNRVQTIDSFAEQLRELMPGVRFGVAHGKLGAGDLEDRIMRFTKHEYDVLVSSTIIENGIDLANANTLIVNNADKFGLAQLYQLRGRVGRGKTQAYAYFLYHGQRLKLDAKKRLRAIVEASDLGSGFQIAMKDLEIRGAGDILGANQHGVINVVGVAHFMRMLNKAVEDLKAGRVMEGEEEVTDVSVDLPLPAYIPGSYISDSKEKINGYQKLSAADSFEYLEEIRKDFVDDYGKMPMEVSNLFKIIELKIWAKKAGVVNIKSEMVPMSKEREIVVHMTGRVKPGNIVNLLEHNGSWKIVGSRLRINMKDLGLNWFDGVLSSIEALSESAKHGAKK